MLGLFSPVKFAVSRKKAELGKMLARTKLIFK
jgi:hypothetical protein